MFTAFQKKVFAAALTCAALCVIGAFGVLLLKLMSDFLSAFATVVAPLVAALIISFILSPLVNFIAKTGRMSVRAACVFVCVASVAAAAVAAAFAVPRVAAEAGAFFSEVPQIVDRFAHKIVQDYPDSGDAVCAQIAKLKEWAAKNFSADTAVTALKNLTTTAAAATGGIVALFSFVAAFAVVPIYLYYMLTTNFDFYAKLDRALSFMSDRSRGDILFFTRRFAEIMATFFRGQLLIALIMGVLYGLGLSLAGVKFGFVLGFAAGVLNLVPYLGTMIGLGTILPVALFQAGGGWLLALLALAVFCAVQCLEGYFLTPRIMGNRTGLHPTVIIFSVFFWGIALDGILGMILAIPLSAFVVASWDRISARWARSEKSGSECSEFE